MKQSCIPEKFVSSHYAPPQQGLQCDEPGSTPEYTTDRGQPVPQAQTICSPSRSGSSAFFFCPPHAQPTQARLTNKGFFPSTPGIPRTQLAVPMCTSSGFPDSIHSAVSGSRCLPFVGTVLQGIRKTVAKALKRFVDTSCVSFIRDQVSRAARLFIRGLEYVAESIEMYNEMCYEGFEYLLLLQERIEEGLRYIEEMEDTDV